MNNSNKKEIIAQRKLTHRQLVEEAQNKWREEMDQLDQSKTDIGHQDTHWNDFLELNLDEALGIELQSKIIELQKRYADLQEQQKLLWAEDNVITEFNKIHAIVHVDQTYILTEKYNALGGKDFSLESRQSFKSFYEDERVITLEGTERSKADIWLKSPKRRKYKGITFDPTTNESNGDQYNLWKGFARKPVKGNCQLYWDHLKEVICSGNVEAYDYLRKWLAYIFQRPNEVHTALVLCGSQGTGKNSLVDPLGILLGPHYAPLSSIAELVSNFNYHLKNAVLIHANEALWGGNKKDLGTLKAMITEATCLIEGKGKDRIVVRNFKHLILSSNEDWPVHLDPDDRRFFVLRVSEKYKGDNKYFALLKEELNDEGHEALLHDLLNEDLSGFNPRILPLNSDSFEIKMRSADSSYRYLREALQQGGFSIGYLPQDCASVWQGPILKDTVYEDYKAWCHNSTETTLPKEQFGKVLKKVFGSIKDVRLSGIPRKWCYEFPGLKQAQTEFSNFFKEKPERIFDNYLDDQASPGECL